MEAVPALIAALNDPSIQVEVVDALARIGQAAAPAIPALKARLSRSFRQEIIEALPSFGKAAVPLLTEIFKEKREISAIPTQTASPMSAGFCVLAWRLEKPLLQLTLT